MKKLLLAGLLALPALALGPRDASAFCFGLKGCFNVKVCANGWLQPYAGYLPAPCPPCGGGGCGPGGCGPGGYGGGGGMYGGCGKFIPGPWYLYWPQNEYAQSAPYMGNWTLENHFQVPAPTGYAYFPPPMTINAAQYPGYGYGYGQAGHGYGQGNYFQTTGYGYGYGH